MGRAGDTPVSSLHDPRPLLEVLLHEATDGRTVQKQTLRKSFDYNVLNPCNILKILEKTTKSPPAVFPANLIKGGGDWAVGCCEVYTRVVKRNISPAFE